MKNLKVYLDGEVLLDIGCQVVENDYRPTDVTPNTNNDMQSADDGYEHIAVCYRSDYSFPSGINNQTILSFMQSLFSGTDYKICGIGYNRNEMYGIKELAENPSMTRLTIDGWSATVPPDDVFFNPALRTYGDTGFFRGTRDVFSFSEISMKAL